MGKKIISFVLIQLVVGLYTVSGILAKISQTTELFGIKFLLIYGGEIFVLGIYAIFWQQIIKKNDLSVAYGNRAMALLWSGIWSALIFKEKINAFQILGIIILCTGIFFINREEG